MARNEIGPSEFSDATSVSFSDLPAAPAAPLKNVMLSDETSLFIEWDFVSDT